VSLSDVAQHRSATPPSAAPDEEAPPAFYQHSDAPLQVPPSTLEDLATREVTVRNIMMPTLFCVSADTPVDAIADKMLRSRLHRLLVVRPGSRRDVVGIITTLDLLPVLRDLGRRDTAS
jgi:CBS domain-containing protein